MAKVMGKMAFKREVRNVHHKDERHEQSLTNTVARTASEYSRASSLHGIQYILETSKRNLFGSRLFWLAIVISAAAIGVIWSRTAYYEWQGNPVLTSVRTTGMPISGRRFNRKIFGLSFGLKNGSRFHFDSETWLNNPFLDIFSV